MSTALQSLLEALKVAQDWGIFEPEPDRNDNQPTRGPLPAISAGEFEKKYGEMDFLEVVEAISDALAAVTAGPHD